MVTLEGVLWYALIFVQKKMGREKKRGCERAGALCEKKKDVCKEYTA